MIIMRFCAALAVVVVLVFSVGGVWAAQDGLDMQRYHSSIQQADVYVYLGENLSVSEAREKAFRRAKRQVLEAANTYISTNTLVQNGELKSDVMDLGAEGSVRIIEQNDYGVESMKYHVWIKAEVRYVFKPAPRSEDEPEKDAEADKADGKEADVFDNPQAPLTVKAWTDRSHYSKAKHKTVRIYLRGNRDFYARVVNVMSDGTVIQLLPNQYRSEARFKAGETYSIPGDGDQFSLDVVEPYGKETIIVYASEEPLGKVATRSIGKGLSVYKGTATQLGLKTRGIGVVPKGGTGFYEQRWTFSTSP